MSGEQRIRAFLFYVSLLIFCTGLPFIISFALGYKFDRRMGKFTKTGLIVIKSQPAGAAIYFNNAMLNEKTPNTINELLPGRYHIELKYEGFSPYSSDVEVQAGKVTRLEKVILFPTRPDIKQLNRERVSSFLLDDIRGSIYYIDSEHNLIFRSNTDGEKFEQLIHFLPVFPHPKQWKLSPDREKMLYFNWHQLGIIYLQPGNEQFYEPETFVLDYPEHSLQDAFWYSDSYHIVLVSDTHVEIIEAKPNTATVNIANLAKPNSQSFYDQHTDTLYFLDTQKAADGKPYDNVYKIDLSSKLYMFQELKKLREKENPKLPNPK